MSSRDPEELYQEALKKVTEDEGTAYRCSQSDIDATGIFTRHNKLPLVSALQASQELIQHNAPTRSPPHHEQEAIQCLKSAWTEMRAGFWYWHPDLVIKCFFDFDIVFFRGVLRGNVYARWAAFLTRDGNGYGFTARVGDRRARIRLNAEAIFLEEVAISSFRTMFATMLHEMCHAYEIVRVRDEEVESEEHGPDFAARIHAVDRRAKELLRLAAVEDHESFPESPVGEDASG